MIIQILTYIFRIPFIHPLPILCNGIFKLKSLYQFSSNMFKLPNIQMPNPIYQKITCKFNPKFSITNVKFPYTKSAQHQ